METSSTPSKPCKHCYQPIHPQARICQHCLSHQSWIGNNQDPRFPFVIFGGGAVVFLILFLFVHFFDSRKDNEKSSSPVASSIVLSDIKTRFALCSETCEIYIIGEAHNASKQAQSGIVFEVRLFDNEDHVADYLLLKQAKLRIAAQNSSKFRIRGETLLKPNEIKNVEVKAIRSTCY
ncbi:MAG: hypothetical protein LBS40_06665 [Burkholderiales bacterium]|nr:hypothetical protein [Burkholderiales bacterium]